MQKVVILVIILFLTTPTLSQEIENLDWTSKEKKYYKTLKNLANYVSGKSESEISKDTLFEKYIYFKNVLRDSDLERKNKRLADFNGLFSLIPKTIDSIGIDNLDAKPIRFYKDHKIFEPFEKTLSGMDKNVLVYYNKNKPEEPIGTLLFEKRSKKLIAWILLRQGEGGWFFLTFNLL